MEGVYYAFGVVGAELVLVAVITWAVIQLRGETREAREAEARRQLAALEREEEELKKAA